jgi:uncharacterized membrane protein
MTDTDEPSNNSSDHLDKTIQTIARLRAGHRDSATPLRRAVDHLTAIIGRPRSIGIAIVVVAGWILVNLVIAAFGGQPFDPPPFTWLASGISLAALFMVMLVLITQRGEDRLTQDREMLILELVLLCERKITKVIRLAEEERRDNPLIVDRNDADAENMAQPTDPSSMLKTIKETHVSVPE